MTSAPGPARELTDAEIVDLALNRLVAIGPLDREARENGLAALARLAACAERGETLASVIPSLISYALAGPSNEASVAARDSAVERARAAIAGAAPEPERGS